MSNQTKRGNELDSALPAIFLLVTTAVVLAIVLGNRGGDETVNVAVTATRAIVVLENSSTPRPPTNTPTPIVLPEVASNTPTPISLPNTQGDSDDTTPTEAVPTEEPATEAPTETVAATDVPTEAPTGSDEGSEAEAQTVSGDAANGQSLFNEFQAAAGFSCANCHLVDSEAMLIGPGLSGISEHGGDRVDGMSAEDYIRQSILEPNAFVVEGYVANLMPQTYGDIFSADEINDLIAYLMTLDG